MGGTALTGCQAEVLVEHDDMFLQAFIDEHAASGGEQRLDFQEMRLQWRLWRAVDTLQALLGARSIYKLQHYSFAAAKSVYDDILRQEPDIYSRFSMVYHKVVFWLLRGEIYFATLKEWVKRGKRRHQRSPLFAA